MKLVLKILALPVLFVVKVICILGNLLTNVVSYVIGLLLIFHLHRTSCSFDRRNGGPHIFQYCQ